MNKVLPIKRHLFYLLNYGDYPFDSDCKRWLYA